MGVADELHLQRIAGLTSGGLAVRSRRVSPFLIPNPVPALPVGEHVYNICLHIYYDNQQIFFSTTAKQKLLQRYFGGLSGTEQLLSLCLWDSSVDFCLVFFNWQVSSIKFQKCNNMFCQESAPQRTLDVTALLNQHGGVCERATAAVQKCHSE